MTVESLVCVSVRFYRLRWSLRMIRFYSHWPHFIFQRKSLSLSLQHLHNNPSQIKSALSGYKSGLSRSNSTAPFYFIFFSLFFSTCITWFYSYFIDDICLSNVCTYSLIVQKRNSYLLGLHGSTPGESLKASLSQLMRTPLS